MTKSERTRAQIRDVALRSFRERGYDETTIRLIAEEAGVSVGSTHYHFPTKNHLVQELYVDVQEAHRAAAEPALEGVDDLVERLGIVYRTGLVQLAPFHRFAPGFLSASVSPKSPINPLSEESTEARDIVVGLFSDAVSGAKKHGLPADLVAALPSAFMLAHLLLALFWVYDTSPDQEKTEKLLARGLRLLRLTLPLARIPMMRAPLRELLALIAEVKP